MIKAKFLVSVIGGHKCDGRTAELAEKAGKVIAEEGAVVLTGGLGGIMEAASRGAKNAGGETVGIIPGENKDSANAFIDIVITTGMGYSRNTLVAGSADMLVALPGKYGTLSEIAFALNAKKPVYGFDAWDIPGVENLESLEDLREAIQKNMQRE